MSDDNDERITMDPPTQSSVNEDDDTIEANRITIELRRNERDRHIRMYKELINTKTRLADLAINQILRVLASSDEIGDEQILLGSLAFTTALYTNCPFEDFTNELIKCWSLQEPFLSAFNENFQIRDLEWFKLVITHGYVQVNVEKIRSHEMMAMAFVILHKNCLTYTTFSYIAYKILQKWLEITWKMNFWLDNVTDQMESQLEAIIFSNWDNCINEAARRNTTQIFPIYLRIMYEKYDNFLELIFESCMQNLSWQNETKYAILVEVCKISNDLSFIVKSDLTSCIFTSLTKNHLKSSGTLLYLTILGKLKADEWESIFGNEFFRISAEWETEKELTAIELLWEQWIKPTLRKFSNIFEYLWKHPLMKQLDLSQTYLEKVGDQQLFKFFYNDRELFDILNSRIVDISESVRLNAFAVICQVNNWNVATNETDAFAVVKRFLYFNANASTISMRKGIIENFKIFLANIVKLAVTDSDIDRHARKFVRWLHEFLLDCFEIGSSYQRKILGLNLYGIILNFTSDDFVEGSSAKTAKYQATLMCAKALRTRMVEKNTWNFIDRKSAILLVKLVMDQMVDVRDKSTLIIIRYFEPEVFTKAEKEMLKERAMKHCSSSRFNEIAGGSGLMRILSAWGFIKTNCVPLFLEKATGELHEMRRDILKSAAQGSSFFGALTAILEVGLTSELANKTISYDSIRKILDLIEEATVFFLSALSTNDQDCAYSSSFAEMSIAVEASINNSEINENNDKCILSPAHQLVVSCIWMSLKVCCELAAEIGSQGETEKDVSRAANLIVSVLLKCRHKGAIEAAGLAVAKLSKVLCRGKYDEVMKSHLANLLSIDSGDNINLTRRGAGLTIMFHRIVSSDDRNNRPFVHFAVGKLLKSLRTKNSPSNEDFLTDSPYARYLHFLRSLVADKGLQAHLVQYMEDICLMCFEYLQSSDWTVRNASLQLFGAIVPRLAGQCSARELDYGIGNSLDHFVTHYPRLAINVLDQLETFVSSINWQGIIRFDDIPHVINVVPILTLLSKMSTGGCDLIDYSSRDYITRGKKVFSMLFGHPVFHVRALAAKAYAAFVPFADIRYELTLMKLRKVNWYYNNYNHGRLLGQYYLERKYDHDMRCTSKTFIIRKHEIYEEEFKIATNVQLERACYMYDMMLYANFPPRKNYTIHKLQCYTISSMLLKCLINCPVALSIMRSTDSSHNETSMACLEYFPLSDAHPFGYSDAEYPIGYSEFLKHLTTFNRQSAANRYERYFYLMFGTNDYDERYNFMCRRGTLHFQLPNIVKEALENFHDLSKNYFFHYQLTAISDAVWYRSKWMWITKEDFRSPVTLLDCKEDLSKLADFLVTIDEKLALPGVTNMRYLGHIIPIELAEINVKLLTTAVRYIYQKIYVKNNDETTAKDLAISCLWRLVEKIFGDKEIVANNDIERELKKNFYDPGTENTQLFLCVVTKLLTDEDPEIRELISEKLSPLTREIIGKSGRTYCSRTNLHKILNKLSSSWRNTSGICVNECLALFQFLTCAISINETKNGLRRPYDEDETFQRDDTELLNILFHCVKTFDKRMSASSDDDNVELEEIDGTIIAKYELQHVAGLDMTNIESFLNLSTSDYLSCKRDALLKGILARTSTSKNL